MPATLPQQTPSWWRSIGLALVTVFTPFVVMGICTALFVSCSHCKKAVWQVLPFAPGLVPGFLLSRQLFHWDSQWLLWVTTGLMEILLVVGVVLLIRRSRAWAVATFIATILVCSGFAMMVLALIRA